MKNIFVFGFCMSDVFCCLMKQQQRRRHAVGCLAAANVDVNNAGRY